MFEKPTLYLITPENLHYEELIKAVEEALKGGADIIQYRAKNKDGKQMVEEAIALKKICFKYNVPLIINDRVDVALISNADGVHVGQDDISVPYVRNLVGNNKIVGLSTKTLQQVKEANYLPVDYIGFGAVFETSTKKDATLAGVENLRNAVKLSIQSVVAIGGIFHDNVKEVIRAGCRSIAVISAVFGSDDIKERAKQLKTLLKE